MSARPAAWLGLALAAALGAPASSHAAPTVAVPEVATLENGLRVAVFRDRRLPIVQLTILVPAGVADEPDDQSGVAQLTAQALRLGSSSRTTAAFTADLERLGGNLSATAGRDYATVSAGFLARDLDAGLELLVDAVTHPLFPDEEVDALRRQAANGVIQNQLNPGGVADEQAWALAFRGHPYRRSMIGTLASLPALGSEQVRAFHRDHYRPDRSVLAIAGDVTLEQAVNAAREWFGNWAGRARAGTPVPPPVRDAGPKVLIMDRVDLKRAEIRLAVPSAPRDAPDFLALALANHCLGGGWWSRLAKAGPEEARSTLTPLRGSGLLVISASCPVDSAGAVATRMRDQLQGLASRPPDQEEMERARRYFRDILPLQLETLAARASQWLAAGFFGLPGDFFDRYDERVAALTSADVAAATRRWLDPSRLVVVAVGPAPTLRKQLEKFGTIEVQSPPPTGVGLEGSKPSAEDEKRGREAFIKALGAHGGQERLANIKDSTVEGDLALVQGPNRMEGTVRQLRKEPMRLVLDSRFQDLETHQVLNGNRAWARAGTDSTAIIDADTLQVAGLAATFNSDLPHLLLDGIEPGARPAFQGRDRIGERDAEAVRLDTPGGGRRRYYFDAESHRLLAIDEPGPPGMGRVMRRLFRDYRDTGGVLWPMAEERQVDGNRIMLFVVKQVAINSGLPDQLFDRPGTSRPTPLKIR